MAIIALGAGLYMVGRFAGGGTAVVAGGTGAWRYAAVIEDRAGPAVGGVAVVTGVATGQVRGVLAGGSGAVVAGEAGANDIGVIDPDHRDPAAGAVAVLADGVGLDMGGVLAGGGGAVVAAGAVAGDIGVVEDGAGPAVGGMAVVTVVATGHVRWRACRWRCVPLWQEEQVPMTLA